MTVRHPKIASLVAYELLGGLGLAAILAPGLVGSDRHLSVHGAWAIWAVLMGFLTLFFPFVLLVGYSIEVVVNVFEERHESRLR